MKKTITGPLALDRGGASWAGWTFAPWGRAREWFLIAPDSTRYSAGEIHELTALMLDVDWLRHRVRELEAQAVGVRMTIEEAAVLRAAAAILARTAPPAARTRLSIAA